MNNYKTKYLKYKLKYLNIKKTLKGGSIYVNQDNKNMPKNKLLELVTEIKFTSISTICDNPKCIEKHLIGITKLNNRPKKILNQTITKKQLSNNYIERLQYLVKNYTHSNSIDFYLTKNKITFSDNTYKLIKNISLDILGLKLILLGPGELIAPFAIHLLKTVGITPEDFSNILSLIEKEEIAKNALKYANIKTKNKAKIKLEQAQKKTNEALITIKSKIVAQGIETENVNNLLKAKTAQKLIDIFSIIIVKGHIIFSSMDNWTIKKNQGIILDTLFDKINKHTLFSKNSPEALNFQDIWGIKNSCIGLILKTICIDKGVLDFDKVIEYLTECRVTVFEICLIYKLLKKNPENYLIFSIPLTETTEISTYSMVFIVNKDIYNNALKIKK